MSEEGWEMDDWDEDCRNPKCDNKVSRYELNMNGMYLCFPCSRHWRLLVKRGIVSLKELTSDNLRSTKSEGK